MEEEKRPRYYRDAMHSYMVLQSAQSVENYQYRMLAANQVPGLLRSSLRFIDGECFLYYEITCMQSLSCLFAQRPIGGEEATCLLRALAAVYARMADYLLDREGLLLEPEYIFMDLGKGSFFFVYSPDLPADGTENSLVRLLAFLSERADGMERGAQRLLYRLCALAENPDFLLTEEALQEESATQETSGDRPNAADRERLPGEKDASAEEALYWTETAGMGEAYRTETTEIGRNHGAGTAGAGTNCYTEAAGMGTNCCTETAGMGANCCTETAGMGTNYREGTAGIGTNYHTETGGAGANYRGRAAGMEAPLRTVSSQNGIPPNGIGAADRTGGGQENDEAASSQVETAQASASARIKKRIFRSLLLSLGLVVAALVLFWLRYTYLLMPEEETTVHAAMLFCLGMAIASAAWGAVMSFVEGKREKRRARDDELQREREAMRPTEEAVVQPKAAPAVPPQQERGAEREIYMEETGRRWKLYGVGESRRFRIGLEALPCTVGRMGEYADQIVDDPSVGRLHARFDGNMAEGEVRVTDLNSLNGTYLNGERLAPNESRRIEAGDEIRLGRVEFCCRG